VLIAPRKTSLSFAAAVASVIAISLAAGCQATKPAPTASTSSSSIQLQPYTASDQSASAGVPAGWKVTKGAQTVIQMTGPEGETLSLGNTFVAQNAAFKAGQRGASGIDLSMPNTAALAQKLAMIFQQDAAIAGQAAPQLSMTSSTPIQLPAALGQCGRFVGDISGQQGAMKLMAIFCSLPLDSRGAYKNIMLYAQAPPSVAAESAPIAQAVFQSYRIPAAWLQKKLSPENPPPVSKADVASAAATMKSTMAGEAAADNSSNCFDLAVLRETPNAQLPKSCGGLAP